VTTVGTLTNADIYDLALKYIPLDEYCNLREQSYREADSRHISHRAIFPGLLLKALQERGILPIDEDAAA